MRTILTAVLLVAAASPAAAQLTVVQRETRGAQTSTFQMQLDASHVRAETRSGTERAAIVYDGPSDTARMLNLDRRTYMEMTRADLQQMGQQMNSAMAAMQQQLATLPPEQRAMVEQMMRGRGAGAAGAAGGPSMLPRTQYRPAGSDKVGQWACTKYEGYRGAEKVSEVCAAAPAALGLTAADFEVTRKLAAFFSGLMPQNADQMSVLGTLEEQGYVGFPLRQTTLRAGAVESVREVTELRRGALPAGTFEVPAGFRKEAMPGAR